MLTRDSQLQFALCESLTFAALAASGIYHDLLADLEASHIRHDEERAFRIRTELTGVLLDRDAAIAALSEHERAHAKTSTAAKGKHPG